MTPRARATDCLPVRFIAAPPMRGHRTYLDLSHRAASPVSPAGARPSPISAVEAGADKGEA